jgi:nucleoside 2-deoxyribosyltransferase
MKVVYLAGPIHGRLDLECKAWRNEAAAILGVHDIKCLDPLDHDYRGVEEEFADEIVARDEQMIDEADVVLVNASEPSWGTAMEVFYAKNLGKVVIAFTHSDAISPWLRVHTTAIFGTLAQAIGAIVFRDATGMR